LFGGRYENTEALEALADEPMPHAPSPKLVSLTMRGMKSAEPAQKV
jgi:hypothetical protein